jgi:anti-sigma regulatory factor (Ser/Thr protein kinase)
MLAIQGDSGGSEPRTERTFPALPRILAEIRRFVRERAEESSLDEERAEDLVIAACEAATNAVLHSGSAELTVTWEDGPSETVVEVRDLGVFHSRVRVPEAEGTGGYGIPLMMSVVDEVVIREGTQERPGTTVRLVRRQSTVENPSNDPRSVRA